MNRKRMTWKKASEHPAYPDEGPASPAYDGQTPADAYDIGGPSEFAEDPHPGPYPNSAHPATPDEGPASPAYKAASLERKAAKCIRIASAMLGENATVSAVEDQALALMDLSDRAIQASLSRIAGEEASEEEEEASEEESSKKAFDSRISRLERVLIRLAGEEDEDEDEDDSDDDEDDSDEESSKKASDAKLLDRMLREERMGRYASSRPRRRSRKAYMEGMHDDESMLAEMMAEEGMSHDEASEEESMLAEMMAEEGMDHGEPMKHEEASEEESMLAEMMAEEGMDMSIPGAAEVMAPDGMDQNDPASFYDEGMEDAEMSVEMMDESMEDPMGMVDMEMMDDDEKMVLASIYGEDSKKASAPKVRPQPKKASKGATRLGGVTKAASDVNDLSSLWESAPDVSKHF
jgi:hypothetical protein